MIAPEHTTPADLAAHLGIPERRLRATARRIGACRIFGKTMVFTSDDVKAILEAARPCPSNSTAAAKSGTIAAPLPEGDFAALQALRTRQERKGWQWKKRTASGKVISMVRRRS